MGALLLTLRLLLSFVFFIAAFGKLLDRKAARQNVIDFGLPKEVAVLGASLLVTAEISVAVALIPVGTAWWGAVGALVLLLLFIVVITANLLLGRKPECRCFGQVHKEPVGLATLFRNAVLTIAAGFVVSNGWHNPGPSLFGWWVYTFRHGKKWVSLEVSVAC